MKVDKLREKNKGELEKILSQKKEKLQEVRFNLSSGRVKNTKEARDLRKDVARISTILKESKYEK